MASIASALSAARSVVALSGTYVTTKAGISVPAGKSLRLEADAKLKIADGEFNTFTTGSTTQAVTLSGNKARFVGAIDGNRDGSTKTANNAGHTATTRQFNRGIVANGTAGAPLTGLYVDATVTGVIEGAVAFSYVNDSYIRVNVKDSGGGVELKNCDNVVVEYVADDLNPDGWISAASGGYMFDCTRITGRIAIRNQGGTVGLQLGGDPAWNVGFTMVACSDVRLDELVCEFMDDDNQLRGLGVSLIGVQDMHVDRLRIHGYSNLLLELGGVQDSTFGQIDLDGKYRLYPGKTGHDGIGIALKNNSFRPDFISMSPEYTRNVQFLGGRVRRCTGEAVAMLRTLDTTWVGVQVESSWKGLYSESSYWSDAGYTVGIPATTTQNSGHTFIDCDFDFHERSGIDLYDGADFRFIKCRARNNSQAGAYGVLTGNMTTACRLGLGAGTDTAGARTITGGNKSGLLFDVDCDDTQSFNTPGFLNPATPRIIHVEQTERFTAGQTLTLSGCGPSGGALVVRVNDVFREQITIDRDIVTFPSATGLSGQTISTSGTTLTGSGTSFLTSFTGTAWVEVGSAFRRVIKVSSNTSATLASAFASNVAGGTALAFRKTTITSGHSQYYGISVSADTTSVVLPAKAPVGNVTAAVFIGSGISASAVTYMADTSTAQTFKNKTLSLTDNVVTGTLTQFNTAVSDADLATQSDVATLNASISAVSASVAGLSLANTLSDFPTGEANVPRWMVNLPTTSTGNELMRLGYWTAQKTETITKVRTVSGTPAAAGATLVKIGVFSVATNGDLTLVAKTADLSATTWIATNTPYTSNFTASWTKTKGQRYATAVLVVGASTVPTLAGFYSPIAASELAESPRVMGHVSATDFGTIGSTIAGSGVSNSSAGIAYMVLLPA